MQNINSIFNNRHNNVSGRLHVLVEGSHNGQEIRVQIQVLIAPLGIEILHFLLLESHYHPCGKHKKWLYRAVPVTKSEYMNTSLYEWIG